MVQILQTYFLVRIQKSLLVMTALGLGLGLGSRSRVQVREEGSARIRARLKDVSYQTNKPYFRTTEPSENIKVTNLQKIRQSPKELTRKTHCVLLHP